MSMLLGTGSLSEAGLVALVVATTKATLILIVAAAVAGVLRRASAAVRHSVWSLALGALLLLPLVSVALPAWTISLPRPSAEPGALPGHDALISLVSRSSSAADAVHASQTAGGANVAITRRGEDAGPKFLGRGLPDRLLAAWAVGALLVLAWVLVGQVQARQLARRAKPVRDSDWGEPLESARRDLGIRAPVALLQSGCTDTPATCGLLRPVILLPNASGAWSAQRRRAVLLHELGHVKRRDCLTHLLAQLACALFWYHPGVWYASGRLRIERERACDDLALNAGMLASDYAGQLLELDRSLRWARRPPRAAVAMAQRPHLEIRLRAILDAAQSRWAPSRAGQGFFALVALGLILPLAAMRIDGAEESRRALPRITTVFPGAPEPHLISGSPRAATPANESPGAPYPREHNVAAPQKAGPGPPLPSSAEWSLRVVEPEIVDRGSGERACRGPLDRGTGRPDSCAPAVIQSVAVLAHGSEAGVLPGGAQRSISMDEDRSPSIAEAVLAIALELPQVRIDAAPVLAPDGSARTGLQPPRRTGLPPGQSRVVEVVGGWIRVILPRGAAGGERYPAARPHW